MRPHQTITHQAPLPWNPPARIVGAIAIPFLQGPSRPRSSCTDRQTFLTTEPPGFSIFLCKASLSLLQVSFFLCFLKHNFFSPYLKYFTLSGTLSSVLTCWHFQNIETNIKQIIFFLIAVHYPCFSPSDSYSLKVVLPQ